jgi:hypothetical protein
VLGQAFDSGHSGAEPERHLILRIFGRLAGYLFQMKVYLYMAITSKL